MLLAPALGCVSDPIPAGVAMEQVVLDLPFQQSFEDTPGAKRVVVCRLKDLRPETMFIGGCVDDDGAEVTKYVLRQDATEALAKILAGNFKYIGFNVTYLDYCPDVRGDTIRGIVKDTGADFVVVGKLNKFDISVMQDPKRTAIADLQYQFSLYNKNGQLRANHLGPVKVAEPVGDQARNPWVVSKVMLKGVDEMCSMAFDETFFIESIEKNPEEVRKLMAQRPPLTQAPAPAPAPEPMPPADDTSDEAPADTMDETTE
jgi:hypothetical protein